MTGGTYRRTREGAVRDCPLCGAELASKWDHARDCPRYVDPEGERCP